VMLYYYVGVVIHFCMIIVRDHIGHYDRTLPVDMRVGLPVEMGVIILFMRHRISSVFMRDFKIYRNYGYLGSGKDAHVIGVFFWHFGITYCWTTQRPTHDNSGDTKTVAEKNKKENLGGLTSRNGG